jgi:organic radical activating enzyme
MHSISNKVDFYITNVCNLTCNNCNRFNNHNFRGWQRWADYESDYTQWSKLVKLTAATIMGGEPFLNPTLGDWIQGINNLFGIEVQVLTNGTRFAQSKRLYEKFLYQSCATQPMNHIGVSLHNTDQTDQLHADILDFLQGPVDIFPKGHTENNWNSDWKFVDANGIMVNVYIVDHFTDSALTQVRKLNNPSGPINFQLSQSLTKTLSFKLYNNSPDKAHSNCAFAIFKSYHFIRGRLYKCGPVALMPEFDQQHVIDISKDDRALLNSYQSLGVDNFEQFHEEFFDKLDQAIPQCKFCPEEQNIHKIYPVRKGSK